MEAVSEMFIIVERYDADCLYPTEGEPFGSREEAVEVAEEMAKSSQAAVWSVTYSVHQLGPALWEG